MDCLLYVCVRHAARARGAGDLGGCVVAHSPCLLLQVSLSGVTTKGIIAGTTKFQVWEAYQGQFTDQGNSPYFVCTNKGCDPTQPVSLALSNPTAVPTGYTLTFSYVLPPAVYNGQFRLGACAVRARRGRGARNARCFFSPPAHSLAPLTFRPRRGARSHLGRGPGPLPV